MFRLLPLTTLAAGLTLLLPPLVLAEGRPLPPVQVYKAPG
jgi:hypothetical protein